jgi:pimeloyl-ACP methyl ester carboxylesterase
MQLLMDELDAVCSSLRLSGTSSDSGFHIYAHGSGGMVALQYAAQRAPPGLRSLVLASVPDSYQALIDDRRAAAQALGPAPAEVLVNREGDASAKAEFQAALGVYNRAYISRQDPGCLAAARQGRSGAAFEALAGRRLFSAAGQLAGWDCADSAARLGGLPVLVCRGERDEVSAGSAGRLAAALQAGKLATVPGAGSYMHIDAWEPHLETVEGFISAAEGSKTVTAGG